MTVWIVLFSIALVFDCLLLSLLVLLQLPKKDAGVGMAFGGGTADALFGSGSGTALTQLTKYTAGAFFVLVFLLSILASRAHHSDGSGFKRAVDAANLPAQPALRTTPTTAATTNAPAATNAGIPLNISSNTSGLLTQPPTTTPVANNAPGTPKK